MNRLLELKESLGRYTLLDRFTRLLKPEKEKNPYVCTSPDGTRSIWIYRDDESEVERVIFHSVRNNVNLRILEVCRSAHGDTLSYTLMLEAVLTDRSESVTRWGQYDEDGIIQWTGGSSVYIGESPQKSRESMLKSGYISMVNVPERIDFNATVTKFLQNAMSPDPSFDTPTFVPFVEMSLDHEGYKQLPTSSE